MEIEKTEKQRTVSVDRVVACRTDHDFDQYKAGWERFWRNNPDSTGYQHPGWFNVLNAAFNVDLFFLLALDDNKQCSGILPLYSTGSFFTESCLTSMESGILALDSTTAKLLLKESLLLSENLRSDFLLLKGGESTFVREPDRETVFLFPTIDLQPSIEEIWSNLAQKTRWSVRKARRHGLNVVRRKHNIRTIYAIYAQDMKRLGTPVQGYDFFCSLVKYLGESVLVHEVVKGPETIGGMISFAGNSGWVNHMATVKAEYKPLLANYLLYWSVIEDAKVHGVKSFNLGRTRPGSNYHFFKRKWRGEDNEIVYQYFFNKGYIETSQLDSLYTGGSYKQKIWSHLPLVICNTLGPYLRKKLPFG